MQLDAKFPLFLRAIFWLFRFESEFSDRNDILLDVVVKPDDGVRKLCNISCIRAKICASGIMAGVPQVPASDSNQVKRDGRPVIASASILWLHVQ